MYAIIGCYTDKNGQNCGESLGEFSTFEAATEFAKSHIGEYDYCEISDLDTGALFTVFNSH